MNILIVEDDQFKSASLLRFCEECAPEASIFTAKSLAAASAIIQTQPLDLLLLDMSLPTYSIDQTEAGGRPQGFGGTVLLRLIDSLEVEVPTIVVTQFERFGAGAESLDLSGLRNRLAEEFAPNFRGLVFYDAGSEGWKAELRALFFPDHRAT